MAFAGATALSIANAMAEIPNVTFLRDSMHFLQFRFFQALQNHLGFRSLLTTAHTYYTGQLPAYQFPTCRPTGSRTQERRQH